MAEGAFDKWAAEQAPADEAAAPAAKPRYAPAPTTPDGAQARLAEVQAAEQDIRAWAESKRLKKPGNVAGLSASAAPPPLATEKPQGPGAFDKWASTIEPPPAPPPPKPPGLLARAGAFLTEGRSQPDPSLSGITAEQARGLTAADEPQPPPAEPKGLDAAVPRARRGGLRSESQPFVAGYAERENPPPAPKTAGQMLETPGEPVLSDEQRLAQEREQGSKSPALLARERAEAQRAARDDVPFQEAKPLELTNRITADIRDGVKNPALRGVIAGASELGKVGTGAVRLVADLFGADDVAKFAQGAERRADATSKGSTQDLKGNEKLVADVFSSIVNSVPSMSLGVAGVGSKVALNTLFAQSTLQEYGAGRDAGFGVGESLTRATIMGYAEALGEKFGFGEQIKLLKSVTKGLPSNQVAKVFGNMLVKEVPGEQLTTAMQFLADKIGPAALRPNATISDYLEAAGETLKVTIGQSLVMGGGPAAINVTRNELANADRVSARMNPAERAAADTGFVGRSIERYMEPVAEQDAPPSELRAAAVRRFDELVAAFGLKPSAAKSAREAANNMPAADAPGFLARLAESFSKRGLFQKPIDEQGVEDLKRAVDSSEAETGAPQDQSAPGNEGATDGQQEGDAQGQPQGQAQEGLLTPAPASPVAGAQDYTGLDETLDQAAHQAATSPLNDRPEPTDAQKEAGNYKVGRVRISGMDVSIENPKGSERKSKADDPNPWRVTMPAHYGYIRGSTGADGDHVDLFIGDKGDNGAFWVINQTTPDGSAFDEHKVITGVDSAAEAIELYRRSFADDFGSKVLGSVSQRMDAGQIKALLPDMSRANAVHTPKAIDDNKPDVAGPAAKPAGAADGSGVQPGGSVGAVGFVPAEPWPVDRPAAAPAAGAGPAPALADGSGPDAALNAAAPVTTQAPAQAGATEAAAPRVIGKYGRTPKASVEVELRKNEDGTWTPFSERYAMVDFESGEPIVLPADVTDAQAADAIRAHGAITARDKFFGVKKDAAPADGTAAPAAEPAAAEHAPQPQPTREDLLLAAEKRVDGLKALLACLTS